MMKIKAFALILCIILCFSVLMVGCEKECTEHVDENKDAKCDVCEADVACETHVDEVRDLKCDVCGEALECTEHVNEDEDRLCDLCGVQAVPDCVPHADEDGNLVCDTCRAELPKPCEVHTDADADGKCDGCNGAIVVIEHTAPAPEKEEKVEMIVNVIPTDAKAEEYIKGFVENVTPGTAVKFEGYEISERFYKTVSYDAETGTNTVSVKTFDSDMAVVTITVLPSEDVEISTIGGMIFVVKTTSWDYTLSAYSYEGTPMFSKTIELSEYIYDYFAIDYRNGWTFVKLDEKIYVVDSANGNVIAKELDAKTFVAYPSFDAYNNNYGYVEYDNAIYVYDNTKLVECVYVYDIPSYYEHCEWYVLENGNVLVFSCIELEDNAVSYDFYTDGNKYDMIYEIVDPSAKTVTKVEFGYFIGNMNNGGGYFTEKALNVAMVYPIENGRVNQYDAKTLVVDNELKVLFDATKYFNENIVSLEPVADNVYLARIAIGGSDYVKALVNCNGEVITYLADSAEIYLGHVYYNNNFYDFQMNEVLADYEIWEYHGNYAVLYKMTETEEGDTKIELFVYDGKNLTSVENVVAYYEFGYITSTSDEETGAITFEVYSYSGVRLFDYVDGWVNSCSTMANGDVKITVATYVEAEEEGELGSYEYVTYIIK